MLPPPSPTPTQQRPRRQPAWIRVVPMMLMNAVKYALVWYIFTQGETVVSRSLWGLALVGWWVYEGWGEVRRIGGGEVGAGAGAVPPAARAVAAQAVQPISAGASAAAVTADSTSSSDSSAPAPPPRPLPTFHLPPTSSPFHSLALIGLANESSLLSLSPSSSETPHAPPTSPTTLLQTLLLAPLLLLLSIAPPLEALRSSAIRSRERVMRELVEVLTRNAANEAQNLEGGGDASTSTSNPTVVVPPPPSHVLLPPGLGIEAKGYYRRVLERGERIDWAEEEEAQREGLERERERERERGGGGLGGLF
ncbi:hypothetical protein BDY24DRAFT_263585 [Mrakia frigida]|uniref:uncharacterized protein n=1 Tax=Mrakia frigida TaxID=29902 RepID=UPI003FCC227C